jgi:hypothetical protein
MAKPLRTFSVVAAMGMALTVAGCVLITGGTDGYSAAEGGVSGVGCQTPADCHGQVCCFVLGDGGVPSTACQATCPAWEQSCAVGSDCGEGGACLAQSCTVEGTTVQVTTCGAISFCTQ